MKISIWNIISLLFVSLGAFGLMGFLFWNTGILGLEEAVIFSIIAVIFSYFRAFLVFVFYFIIVSLVMAIAIFGISYTLGFSLNDINRISGTQFLFWFLGGLALDFGISAFLTKRTRDKEKEKEMRYQHEANYERPPNPNDFNDEEQKRREQEAYERGRREAETKNNEMTEEEAYQWLGVKKGARKEEVQTAYRRISKIIHPDATQMKTDELMKKVNQAYEKLEKEGKNE